MHFLATMLLVVSSAGSAAGHLRRLADDCTGACSAATCTAYKFECSASSSYVCYEGGAAGGCSAEESILLDNTDCDACCDLDMCTEYKYVPATNTTAGFFVAPLVAGAVAWGLVAGLIIAAVVIILIFIYFKKQPMTSDPESESLIGSKATCWEKVPCCPAYHEHQNRLNLQLQLNLALKSVIEFDGGDKTIKAPSMDVVKNLADILKGYPDEVITIEGHTDNDNVPLSQDRADAVKAALADLGIPPDNILTKGYGHQFLLKGAGKNSRRVEFKVMGLSTQETRSGDKNYDK